MSNWLANSSVEAFAKSAGIADKENYSVVASNSFFIVATATEKFQVTFKKDGKDTVGFTSNLRHHVTREEAGDLLLMIQMKLTLGERTRYYSDLNRLSASLSNLGFRQDAPIWHMGLDCGDDVCPT